MMNIYMTRDNLEELVFNTLAAGATMDEINTLIKKLNIQVRN